LVTHIAMSMHNEDGMPLDFQIELLRRFNYYIQLSSQEGVLNLDSANPYDPAQLDLFPDTK